jgi:quinol monooxygenase YgiN
VIWTNLDTLFRYEDVEANTETHRASAEYKAFRRAVGLEGLLERPSDLRFWRPLLGFIIQGEPVDFSTLAAEQYIVTHELTPNSGKKEEIVEQLRVLAQEAEGSQVLSFWILHRGDEETDESLLVFARYRDKNQLLDTEDRSEVQAGWKKVHQYCTETRRTTWVASCLGFLGR